MFIREGLIEGEMLKLNKEGTKNKCNNVCIFIRVRVCRNKLEMEGERGGEQKRNFCDLLTYKALSD